MKQKQLECLCFYFLENEVDKSEMSNDADSIWTDGDEDLLKSESTEGKNMLPQRITVQPDKQTYYE